MKATITKPGPEAVAVRASDGDAPAVGLARSAVVAMAALGAAIGLRATLQPWLGGTQVWITFWPATFLAAWFGGLRAGLALTAVSIAVVSYWLVPPPFELSMTPEAFVGTCVFLVCGAAFSGVAESARRARLEEQRQRQRAESARADAVRASGAKDELLAMVGHELRNPLAPISSAAELLRLRHGESRELEVIGRQVRHLARLLDDLRDVSRIVRGDVELRRDRLELAAIVEKALEMLAPQRERGGHRVEVGVPAGLAVDGDEARLVQIVSNLLSNAMKFSPPDAPIRVTGERADGSLRLRVIDAGAGMDAALLARVFDPFAQGPQALHRPAGGLGLGLAIARRLARAHGGDLTAASEGPGRGSELCLTLPAASPERPAG